MAVILSDTDCIVDFLKHRSPENGRVRRALLDGTLAISVVTAYELYFGEPSGTGRAWLDDLLANTTVVPLNLQAAAIAAAHGARLAATGMKLDAPDLLIGGTALEMGISLITRNLRHFGRLTGLAIADPY